MAEVQWMRLAGDRMEKPGKDLYPKMNEQGLNKKMMKSWNFDVMTSLAKISNIDDSVILELNVKLFLNLITKIEVKIY